MVAVITAMVGVMRRGQSRRTASIWSRTRSSRGSRTGSRTLTEGVKSSIFLDWNWRRSCRDHVNTPVGGRLLNLICLGCELSGVLDVLPHQVGVDGQGKVVEEESLEYEALSFVDPMIQRK